MWFCQDVRENRNFCEIAEQGIDLEFEVEWFSNS